MNNLLFFNIIDNKVPTYVVINTSNKKSKRFSKTSFKNLLTLFDSKSTSITSKEYKQIKKDYNVS